MLPRSDAYHRNRRWGRDSSPTNTPWYHSLFWGLFGLATVVLLGLAVLTLRCGGLGWVRP